MTRRMFSREFRIEAVRLVTDRGVAVAQAARDLDAAESVQRRWMRELTAAPAAAFPGNGQMRADLAEIAALKKEVAKRHLEHTPRWPPRVTPPAAMKLHQLLGRLRVDALLMAVWRRGKADALLHHLDQGSQSTSDQFQRCCPTTASPAR